MLWDPAHREHQSKIKQEDARVDLASSLERQVEVYQKQMISLFRFIKERKSKDCKTPQAQEKVSIY